MRGVVTRGDETGQTCHDDIVGPQVRIILCMPDTGSKDQQDNRKELPPGGLLGNRQTQHEEQGKPPEHRVEADAYQIPDEVPFARGAACRPQEQQHNEKTDRL